MEQRFLESSLAQARKDERLLDGKAPAEAVSELSSLGLPEHGPWPLRLLRPRPRLASPLHLSQNKVEKPGVGHLSFCPRVPPTKDRIKVKKLRALEVVETVSLTTWHRGDESSGARIENYIMLNGSLPSRFFRCLYTQKCHARELPLWCKEISGVLGALGGGFHPGLAQRIKDLALPQLRWQLQLGSDLLAMCRGAETALETQNGHSHPLSSDTPAPSEVWNPLSCSKKATLHAELLAVGDGLSWQGEGEERGGPSQPRLGGTALKQRPGLGDWNSSSFCEPNTPGRRLTAPPGSCHYERTNWTRSKISQGPATGQRL